jgi:hypothetical protein
MSQPPPIGARLGSAFGSGVVAALAIAAAGLAGHLLGNRLYPQPDEQVPSDLLLVPFGLIAGFCVGAGARLVKPRSMTAEIGGVVVLAAFVYGVMNFRYAEGRAIPAGILVDFEPDPATADRCHADCPPNTEWTVQGFVRVRAIRVEGTIVGMTISSTEPPPSGRNTILPDRSLARYRGPRVRLDAKEIAGDLHLKANDVRRFPIRYSYQNRGAESAREILVNVDMIDTRGYPVDNGRLWHVR